MSINAVWLAVDVDQPVERNDSTVVKCRLTLAVLFALSAAVALSGCRGGDFTETPPRHYGLTSTSTPMPAIVPLPADVHGYVHVATQSSSVFCSVAVDIVACQTPADNWPRHADGHRFHCASVTADGDFHWVDADLGGLEGLIALDYRTYGAQGWRITATRGGTTFANDRTGHGMVIGTTEVVPF